MMITREEACRALADLMNSGLFNEDVNDALNDIAICIQGEQDQMHLWGADDDEVTKLYTAKRTNSPDYEQFCKECDELFAKYVYGPSRFEAGQLETEQLARDEESEDE